MAGDALTPMMQQYHALKREAPADALLFFRLGDFYEMFFEDAEKASAALDLTLTQRQGTPMCGVPYHTAQTYISRLIALGYRIAICDQLETPRPGQLVRRGITQIISRGTVLEGEMLSPKRNNYCCAYFIGSQGVGLAVMDLTTGEFRAGEAPRHAINEADDCVMRWQPAELILPVGQAPPAIGLDAVQTFCDPWTFSLDNARYTLLQHFSLHSLDAFGLETLPLATSAAGALLHYVKETMRRDVSHILQLRLVEREQVLTLDPTTLRNLEILEPLSKQAPAQASLLAAMDRTVTAGGARLLRQWITAPLRNPEAIRARLDVVAYWVKHEREREYFREILRQVKDIERLIARLSLGSGNGRDLAALRATLERLPEVRKVLSDVPCDLAQNLCREIIYPQALHELLIRALVDEPPLAVKEGGLIRDGYHEEVDELRQATTRGKDWIAQLQQKEQERTGIKSLKIRYNSVFGYYIEVSHAQRSAVPEDYIRKQTLANAERYVTPELKEMEHKILGAEERVRQLEYELFLELRAAAVKETAALQATAAAISAADVLAGWALLAREQQYARPVLNEEQTLRIEEGRHPVLEQLTLTARFVPNDTVLSEETRLVILTGPNMAGKSTYLRQTALIAVMAHCGSYVPAKSAWVPIMDRVFTRVGAADDLARGQSTFMVEMSETAHILHHATEKSLVILDEIGRGTSTFDGLSIAWAVAEYLHTELQAKTLFATHYHELTKLAEILPHAANAHVAVREWNDQVIFLHKILPGGVDRSYGIQVARLAGLPKKVLTRAKEILSDLEMGRHEPREVRIVEEGGESGRKAPKAPRIALEETTGDLF
jgi:DNA mismatch repair protein MutS